MLFEETVPVAPRASSSTRDSDEVAWVLAGEITFKIGDDVSVGGPAPARLPAQRPACLERTPAAEPAASCFSTPRPPPRLRRGALKRPGPTNDEERNKLRERYRWEVVGPNPL